MKFSGVFRDGTAAVASLKRWFAASVAAKFMRASIAPVENQSGPSDQPATSGGSNSVWPMLASGVLALSIEKPFQPISRMARTTNSTGQAYRVYQRAGSAIHGDRRM